ncbi:putative axoneme central apparatus protein [Trypanosoma cruzi]|nr:putative axoneme central apparatus protein [Trypanosoma cruzi]
MDPSKVAKMSNQGESALGVTHNARKFRRARSNNLNRSATSFVFVPDEEIIELKEKVEESLDQTTSRGNTLNEGILLPVLSRPRRRKHSSAAASMTSLDIAESSTMEFNLDDTIQSTWNRKRSK